MNNISLNIVANAQFQQVYAEVAKLKESMMTLQKVSVGSPFTSNTVANIKSAQSAFDQAVQSTRAFNIQHVAMTDNVTKFGQSLAAGKLSLSSYYNIWRQSANGVSQELDNLSTTQARLNRSISIADPLRPGYAKLVTDINGVVTAQEKAIFYQQALNTALHDGAMKLIDFGKNTQWMGRQLTVGLTMPLAMFGASLSQAYLSFDKQMTSMLQVYGSHAAVQSQQTLDVIEQQVTGLADKLARTLGIAMSDTVTIAQTFSAIGLEGKNLIAATDATAKLMKLGNLSSQQASNSMVSLQNVFKLQASQVGEAVNFLNAAKHSTSTTMQDIVDALPRVGPIIQQMGGTYKDFTAFLVAMKESGVPAAQGANAMKSMLASMINPTKAAQAALKSMNIDIKSIVANNQGNVMGMVQGMQAALNKLPASDRLKAIEQTFGKFQFARVTALLNNLGSAGSQSAKVLELYNQSNAQLGAVAAQELQVSSSGTPAARFEKMKATLQADLIPLGKTFLTSFTELGNVLDKVLSFFKGIAHTLGPVAMILGKVFGAGLVGAVIIGPILMLTGLFANLLGNVLKGANYLRMFKQGMDDTGPGVNKFAAGLNNMRNFYQDLDLGMVAARNQMDLMPEAITTNAQAFDTLRKAIFNLTTQFESLAVAQTLAMAGTGDAGDLGLAKIAGSVEPGVMQFKLPAFAGGTVGLPGSGSGDSIPALLAPGESVITAAATAKYAPILHGMNNGNLRGFMTGFIGDIPVEMHKQSQFKELESYLADDSPLSPEMKEAIRTELRSKASGQKLKRTTLSGINKSVGKLGIPGWTDTPLGSVGKSSSEGARPSSVGTPINNLRKYSPGARSELEIQSAQAVADAQDAAAEKAGFPSERRKQIGLMSAAHTIPMGSAIKQAAYASGNSGMAGAVWNGVPVQNQESNQMSEMLRYTSNQTQFMKQLEKEKVSQLNLLKQSGASEKEQAALGQKFTALQTKITAGQGLSNEEQILQGKISGRMLLAIQSGEVAQTEITSKLQEYLITSEAGGVALQELKAKYIGAGKTAEEIAQLTATWASAGARTNEELLGMLTNIREQAVLLGDKAAIEAVEGLILGMKEGFVIASPSKATQVIGVQAAAGAVAGMESLIPEAAIAGTSLAAAEIAGFQQMDLPGVGTPLQNRIGGMFPGMSGESAITTETSKFNLTAMDKLKASKFAGLAGGPMGMMGLSMAAPMLASVIPNKIGGTDVSGLKSTVSTAVSLGSMAAMMAPTAALMGPFALGMGGAVLAVKGFSMAMHNAAETTKRNNAMINTSLYVNQTALSAYNSAQGKAPTSTFDLGEIQIAQYDKNSKLAQSSSDAKNQITALAGAITDAGDKAFVASLKTANATERTSMLATKYFGDLQAGGTVYAEQRRLVYQQAAGLKIDSKAAKPTTFNALVNQELNLGAALTPKLPGGKNVVAPWVLPGTLNIARSIVANGYQTDATAKAVGQISKGPATKEELLSKNYLSDINSAFKSLDGVNKLVINSKEVYAAWNADIKKTQPAIAKANDELNKTGVSLQNIVTLDKMMEAGFVRTQAVIDAMKTSAGEMMSMLTAAFPSYQAAVQKDIADAQSKITANQTALTDAQQALSDLQSNGQFTAQNKADVKTDEDKIKVIQDEVTNRNILYDAQMRNIDAQQKQSSLEADIISARGSGDLMKLAVAQQNYQLQKTKDAMANAKANADNASQNKIDALQKTIDDLNARKDIKADPTALNAATAAVAAAQAALAQAQADLATAMSGKGAKASGVSNAMDSVATALTADWATFSKNASKTMIDLVKTFGDKLGTEMMLSITEGKLKTNLEKAFTAAQAKTATSQMDAQFQAQIDAVGKAMKPGAARDKLITQIKKDQVAFDLSLAAAADVYGKSKKTDADKATFDKAVEAVGSKAGTDIGKAEIATGNKDLVTLGNKDLLDFGKTLWTSIETALGTSIAATKAEQVAKMKEHLNQAHLGIMGWFDSIWGALVGNKAIKNPNAVGGHAGTKEDPYSVTTAASKLGKNALNKDGTLTAGGTRQVIQQNKLQASEVGSFFMYQGKKYAIQQGSDATFRAAKGALVGPDVKPIPKKTPPKPTTKYNAPGFPSQVSLKNLSTSSVFDLEKLLAEAKQISKTDNGKLGSVNASDPNLKKYEATGALAAANVSAIQTALTKALEKIKTPPKPPKVKPVIDPKAPLTSIHTGPTTSTHTGTTTSTHTGPTTSTHTGTTTSTHKAPTTSTHTGTTTSTHKAPTTLTVTAPTSSVFSGTSTFTSAKTAINANGATITGAIKATVNVTVVQTTVTQTIKKALGGIIHAASGMLVGPGTSTSDSIPAMLSRGEYVVNASAVSKYGPQFLEAINNKSFAVPGSSLSASKSISDAVAGSTNVGGNVINIYPPIGADSNVIATLVMNKLDQQAARQRTMRSIN